MSEDVINRSPLPMGLEDMRDQIIDIDSHEMLPTQVWVERLGPVAEPFVAEWIRDGSANDDRNHPNVPGYPGDVMPVDPETIWRQKGASSPGAADPLRRHEVMDVVGIARQFMFPGVGMYSFFLTGHIGSDYGFASSITSGRRQYGKDLTQAYNEWAMTIPQTTDRVRPVLPLLGDTPSQLVENARILIDHGIKAVWLLSGTLPGGVSCAHPSLDPLWRLLEDSNVAMMLHGTIQDTYVTDGWRQIPQFEGFKILGEIRVDPWSLATNYIAPQNFLVTMILGGVFERFPRLRFGITEVGMGWVGPMCDYLDMWYRQDPAQRKFGEEGVTFQLSREPSFYVKRNVRVSGFDFERVDQYIERYDLGDVLAFGSDYPHIEGGTDPVGRWYDMLEPLGSEVARKFFVANGEWLMPN